MILLLHKQGHCNTIIVTAVLQNMQKGYCHLGGVSQKFCKLSKIIMRKYTIPEITLIVRISSWNFVHVPKAWLWAHIQSFSLKFSSEVSFLQYTNFERLSRWAHKTWNTPWHIQVLKLSAILICLLVNSGTTSFPFGRVKTQPTSKTIWSKFPISQMN